MVAFSSPFSSMRRFAKYAIPSGLLFAGACMGFDAYDQDASGGGGYTYAGSGAGTTATTGGGAGGIDTNIGGSASPGVFNYAALCGTGCIPGEPCTDPSGTGGGGGMGGASGDPGGYGGEAPLACQLQLDETTQAVNGTCAPVGTSAADMPCLDSSDCAPGLGCVAGVCRSYCCDSLDACEGDTYCAPQPMVAGDLPAEIPPPFIPVCIKVQDCVLLSDDTCPQGQTCTVVKSDGTVSCVAPGTGLAGDPCQCAPGHACKPEINTCFKLCKLDRPTDCPSDHTCQGGVSAYPQGFGVCVAN